MPSTDIILAGGALWLLLLGSALLFRWFRPARRGETPHCRRCDYNLTGIDSTNCPECGAELSPQGIVRGDAMRSAPKAWAGAAMILLAILYLGGRGLVSYGGVDLSQHKPTAWLIDDLRSRESNRQWQALNELERRELLAPLSDDQMQKLADAILTRLEQPTDPLLQQRLQTRIDQLDRAGLLKGRELSRYVAWALTEMDKHAAELGLMSTIGFAGPSPFYAGSGGSQGAQGDGAEARIDRQIQRKRLTPEQETAAIEATIKVHEAGDSPSGLGTSLARWNAQGKLSPAQRDRYLAQENRRNSPAPVGGADDWAGAVTPAGRSNATPQILSCAVSCQPLALSAALRITSSTARPSSTPAIGRLPSRRQSANWPIAYSMLATFSKVLLLGSS